MDVILHTLGHMACVFVDPASLKYLLVLYLLAAVALPLCHRFFDRSRVTWFLAAKLLGLSLLSWTAWWLSHNAFGWSPASVTGDHGPLTRLVICIGGNGVGLLPHSLPVLYGLLAAGMALAARGYERWGPQILRRLRRNWKPIVAAEITFLVAFAFCAVLRMHSPDIRNHEKEMDFAFLNACIYATEMPPPDPWLYEKPIHYYYGGHLQMATLAKMTAVRPEVAYNLSVAVLFALTCVLAFAIAYELSPRVRWALLGVVMVAFMGNLDVAAQNWEHWKSADPSKGFAVNHWRASRVIHDGPTPTEQVETINEFPFFTFYHADLHAHMTATPYVLLVLAMLLNVCLRPGRAAQAFGVGTRRWPRLLLVGWALGSVLMINLLDFATLSFLTVCVLGFREWASRTEGGKHGWLEALFLATLVASAAVASLLKFRGMLAGAYAPDPSPWQGALTAGLASAAFVALTLLVLLVRRWNKQGRPSLVSARVLGVAALVALCAIITVLPFLLNYDAPLRGKSFEKPTGATSLAGAVSDHFRNGLSVGAADFRSGPVEFLTVWGTQMACVAALLLALALPTVRRRFSAKASAFWCAVGAAWLVLYCLEGHVVSATLLLLLAASLLVFAYARKTPRERFVFAAVAASLAILWGCEHFYFRDVYGNNAQRLNTLFKFYYATWLILGVCAPFCLRRALRQKGASPWRRRVLVGVALLLVAWAMEYPVAVSMQRFERYRALPRGGVSLDGIAYLRREHPGDFAAIQWLRKNIRSGDTVLEAPAAAYTYAARIATHTPSRTVLGWTQHQFLWRGSYFPEVEADMKRIYAAPRMDGALPLLRKYGVGYVYVGELERKGFDAARLAKFDALTAVYRDDANQTAIYKVPSAGVLSQSLRPGSLTR